MNAGATAHRRVPVGPVARQHQDGEVAPGPCPYVRRDFRALRKRAGIEGLRAPRELRHTFVSVMSESGIAVAEITLLTGHSSARTTQTIYRHELRPVITTGADAMDKIFI